MLVLKKWGVYREASFYSIPYQHHKNNLLWCVLVGLEERYEHINVIAHTSEEAANLAMKKFKKKLDEEMLEQIEKQDEIDIANWKQSQIDIANSLA